MIQDKFQRSLRSLRISVTDRCNLRCSYCMPAQDYVWLPRESVLSFEEIRRLVSILAGLGAVKVRLTGGEPLLRRDLSTLVRFLAKVPGISDLALTTNGILLQEQACELRTAGLRRITVSLDTLDPSRFEKLARRGRHAEVIAGIDAARAAGFERLKINSVVVRGFNDDELADLLRFARRKGAEIRFIEYMDVGGANRWSADRVVSGKEIRDRLEHLFGPISPLPVDPAAPAKRFTLPDGTSFGIITSTTVPFCGGCDRARLTADGIWYLCLYAREGTDLRSLLRQGATDEMIAGAIRDGWTRRSDRGAEDRFQTRDRKALHSLSELRKDPHLEMHTRGG